MFLSDFSAGLKRPAVYALPGVFLAFFFGTWGLNWGLPSAARAQLFMKPALQTPEFYAKVEKARDDIYNNLGLNPVATYGRMQRLGKPTWDTSNVLSVYSSFLVRTHHGDEQQTLVMLSHLNPLKGLWYPYSFYYGGAYLFPLGAYLRILQTASLIKLVGSASYYYAHPDDIGRVYLWVRGWSVLGLALAASVLFLIGKRLGGVRVGVWASCFYALLPTCIGNAKLAKPHMWAGTWTLTSLYFCLRAKEDAQLRWLILAALSWGLAVGTTTSQIAFLPFLIWACWTPSFMTTFQRAVLAGLLSAAVFLTTNFYIFKHFQDYKDEVYFISHWYPFAFRLPSLWEFAVRGIRTSLSWPLWALVLGSLAYTVSQKENTPIKQLVLLSLVIFAFEAFQNQIEHGTAVVSRLYLALLGLWCVCAAWVADHLPARVWICGGCLVGLLVTAAFYDMHFASDRVPQDNASLASLWVRDHIPANSTIVLDTSLPHPLGFPPIDFLNYHFVQAPGAGFDALKGPAYGILPASDSGDAARAVLLKNGYQRVQVFANSPIQKHGFTDPFTNADFAIEIYAKPS